MMKLFVSLAVFTFFILANPAKAQENIFNNFASCTGVIDSIPFSLDFFEEVDSKSDISTGKGYVVQTMGPLSGENSKMMGKITVTEKADKTAKVVNMYGILNPSTLFSTFEIDLKQKKEIEIFATQFGAIWGKFTCSPQLLP